MEKTFPRSIDSLDSIFEFIEQFFTGEAIDPALRPVINLTVEELFVNMVNYNEGGNTEIRLRMERSDGELVATLTDFDVKRFDPTERPDVDITRPLEERMPGGLGIHLVRKMVDSLDYDYSDGKSTITIRKALGGAPEPGSSGNEHVQD
ncbi:MAG: ATP-binding protein [Gemmatimonadales bacterium]|nr:MAG: ATP-binding protein [Gemmatimonadales bacterium]